MKCWFDRGDTLVEVVVASAVFALLVVSTLVLMNRSINIAQVSLEITLVRQQISSQAELLRFVRSNDRDVWQDLKSYAHSGSAPASIEKVIASGCDSAPAGSFFMAPVIGSGGNKKIVSLEANSSRYSAPETYSIVDLDESRTYGIWIQPTKSEKKSASSSDSYDFHIKACWYGPGSSDIPMTESTIVRLYDDQ